MTKYLLALKKPAFTILFYLLTFISVFAQTDMRFAILGADSQTDLVRSKIENTGRFSGIVDTYDLTVASPDLTTLLNYDAVLVYTNSVPVDPVTLGDNLLLYIDTCTIKYKNVIIVFI